MRGKIFIVSLAVFSLFFGVSLTNAQERSYSYDAIKFNLQVNNDTTVDVTEHQTYRFNGQYHQGWRNIPLKGVSGITDVQVIDAATNQPLVFSPSRLDKTDPDDWGKFTTFRQNGEQVIEWYYNQADTTHEWILKYQLHGALGFQSDRDELYWNLFTSYTVPIANLEAKVELAENQFSTGDLRWHVYGGPVTTMTYSIVDNRSFLLSATGMAPGAVFTVAASWPAGLVDRSAFWRDWLWVNLSYLLAVLLILFAIIYSLVRWYRLEYQPEHSRTVVSEYAPPRNLRPAVLGLIITEGLAVNTWTATIVDLAVRGIVTIEEIKPKSFFSNGNYRLTKKKGGENDSTLAGYEKEFLTVIFEGKEAVTTKELESRGRSRIEGRAFRKQMLKLEDNLPKEVEGEMPIYAVGVSKEKKKKLIVGIIIGIFVLWFFLFGFASIALGSARIAVLIIALILSVVWIYVQKYEARLSPEGMQLKREILGFKLYLKTADRFRLQNLTPDLFEKYLPYAIIFGVENKWAKAFEGLDVPAPEWYSSHAAMAGVSGFSSTGSVGGFSTSVFSNSFSSSFSSAFSSSAGGGASSGGGSAGGGGGGGGGGAS